MFKSDLIVRRIIGVKNTWQLKEPLLWVDEKGRIEVKANFIFDFASVPFLFQRIFPKAGARYDRASCLHDWLYATKLWDRKTADKLFYKAMRADKVGKIKAWIMYKAVRLFGGFAWRKNKPIDISKINNIKGVCPYSGVGQNLVKRKKSL